MLAELRVTPVGPGPSPLAHMAAIVKVLQESPLGYRVHPMGTTLEGSLEEILNVVRRCHGVTREKAPRVLLELSVDDRDIEPGAMTRSIEHLRELAKGTPLDRVLIR